MADAKLATIASVLFCALVVLLLLILYYPEPPDDDNDNPEDAWRREMTINSFTSLEYTESPEPASKIAAVAKVLENMGAGFLALLAVICVSFGLFCLTCACCCLK